MRRRLVSVGRYALRGVAQPQELFTPEPDFHIAFAGEPGTRIRPGVA
jgi:hypothetical protein